MAQVGRVFRTYLLRGLWPSARTTVLRRFPNWRKSAPEGMELIYEEYLGSLRVHINTRYKAERIIWTGMFERPFVNLMQSHIPPGAICIDVGANVGGITLPLARHIGEAGRVIALEPGPPTYARLLANLDLNPELKPRVTPVNQGIDRECGQLYWYEEPGNPGNAFLAATGTIPVPVTTVDQIVADHKLPRVDFIKVDVEGMELPVFEGAVETLRRHHPILYFETLSRFGDAGGVDNSVLMDKLLRDCGYTLYRPEKDGALIPARVEEWWDYTIGLAAPP